ncbi:uncharacterized protein At1g10890-like [Cucurbita maxima]|uniref:Uncharacterized protein At1g10890-like n=1 Tax=Cucurbita maxima TaxID=3661 RepID=A0A6J1I6X0_CUCMA|nr:uncharacterized protein At1g10890-like [Cucurbita maxima]
MEELIQKNVAERLNSEEVKLEIRRRIEEGCKKLFDDVDLQLEKEKEAALTAGRLKEEQARKEREEVDRMLEENRRRVEEGQGREALKLIQRQKEEAPPMKKLE